jgi:hypothetical protein
MLYVFGVNILRSNDGKTFFNKDISVYFASSRLCAKMSLRVPTLPYACSQAMPLEKQKSVE